MISLLSGGSLTGFRMTAIEEKRLGTYTIAHSGYTVGWPFCIEEEKVGDCLVPSRKEDDAPLIPNGCQHPPLYPQFGHHSIDYYYYYYTTMAIMVVVSILFFCWFIHKPLFINMFYYVQRGAFDYVLLDTTKDNITRGRRENLGEIFQKYKKKRKCVAAVIIDHGRRGVMDIIRHRECTYNTRGNVCVYTFVACE